MQERVLLLASHGGLAEGMRDTAAMVLGEFPCEVRTYSLLPGMNAQDAVATLREEVERRPQTEFVILTDVYGASVFTAFCQLLRYSNVRLFCGMNVAMVLRCSPSIQPGSTATALWLFKRRHVKASGT